MRYGSVCSGIEAATVAWHPLGWEPQFFSEIEAFPSAVLAHHYHSNMPGKPLGNGVPNHGDMLNFQDWPDHAIELLVGGTPCQDFSVAGLRAGLAAPRGNLTLTYLGVVARYEPRWVVWENVPGVLSVDGGRAFGAFLGGLAELGYGFAYRVLDAQFVRASGLAYAVPQRRRRVFVVGYFGDWRRAAAVLFDGASLRGDSPPRREAGQNVAPTISARTKGGGGLGADFDLDGGLIDTPAISVTLTARDRKGPLPEADLSTVIVSHALRAEGFDAGEDGTGRGTPLGPIAFHGSQDPDVSGDVTHPLGRNQGQEVAIAYGIRSDAQREGDAKTLSPDAEGKMRLRRPGLGITEGVSPTVDASAAHAVAYDMRGREGGAQFEGPHAASGGSSRSYVADWKVRRLTPVECHRLQGFPDDYLGQVIHRGKPPADGPQYKALGNSMAVNVMRVIGERIAMVDALAGD